MSECECCCYFCDLSLYIHIEIHFFSQSYLFVFFLYILFWPFFFTAPLLFFFKGWRMFFVFFLLEPKKWLLTRFVQKEKVTGTFSLTWTYYSSSVSWLAGFSDPLASCLVFVALSSSRGKKKIIERKNCYISHRLNKPFFLSFHNCYSIEWE